MITLTHQVGARHASPASPKSLASLPFQAIDVLGCLTAGQACLTPTGGQDEMGPVCETADTLASQRELEITKGDLLFIESCGAYGSVMSSNYNARDRAAEVLVEDGTARLIRRRECLNDRLALEIPYLRL